MCRGRGERAGAGAQGRAPWRDLLGLVVEGQGKRQQLFLVCFCLFVLLLSSGSRGHPTIREFGTESLDWFENILELESSLVLSPVLSVELSTS